MFMQKKKILIIEDDPKALSSIIDILGKDFEVKSVAAGEGVSEAASFLPHLVILDNDIKDRDGFELYRKLRRLSSKLKVIMISGSSNVAPAVTAAKLGVNDYLMKPLVPKTFNESIKKLLAEEEVRPSLIITEVSGAEWLKGTSHSIETLFRNIESVLGINSDIILFGEKGINKASIAEIIHVNGLKRRRKFVKLDLLSFKREGTESYFWGSLQELLQERQGGLDIEEEVCGTLFLSGIESLSDHFAQSIFKYLKERKEKTLEGKLDKDIRVIISIEDTSKLISLEKSGLISNFVRLDLPALRERKEDIPILINSYIKKFSDQYSKSISGISGDILELFIVYNWQGNYEELESLIKIAVLNAVEDMISIKNLPMDFKFVVDTSLEEAFSTGDLRLESLRRDFESNFFSVILEKTDWDEAKASQMLDIPRNVFSERIKELGITQRK